MNLMRRFVAVRPTALLVLTVTLTVFVGGCGGGMASTPTPTLTPTAGLNLSSLAFTSQTMGTTSTAQTLTLTNSGTGPLSITSITISGTNSGDFAETNTCGTSLAANANCVISVTFTPTGSGTRSASLTITDNAAGSPQNISLSGTAVAPAIVVNVSPGTANVQAGIGTQSFSATLQNDSQNKGVNWTLSGTGCSGNACGTVAPTSSLSGATITYTAPASVPTPATVTLTATSIADSTKVGTAAITVTPPISVSVAPTSASVQVSKTQSFTATVSNDSQNKGLMWALSGTGCNGATCGTLSTTSSTSGVAIIYTAPSSIPSPATVTLTATSVADTTKSAAVNITVTVAPPPTPMDLGAVQGAPLIAVDAANNIDVAALSVSGVFFRRSVDGGSTFSATPVANAVAQPASLQMGLDAQGHIVLLWLDGSTTFVSVSRDGTSFSMPSSVPTGAALVAPQLSVTPSGVINVAWSVSAGTFSTRSVNDGASFAAPAQIGPPASDLRSVSGPQEQIYVFGSGITGSSIDVFFTRSLDAGQTFSTASNLSTDGRSSEAYAVVDSSGNINLVWRRGITATDPNNKLMFVRSTDQGSTFSTPVVVATTAEFVIPDQEQVVVEANGAIDLTVNADIGGHEGKILFARSVDNGATFSTPMTLYNDGGFPTMGIDSCGGINVAWNSFAGSIFLTRSTDGTTFSAPATLSNANQNYVPRIATDSRGNTFVVWEGLVSNTENDAFFLVAAQHGITCKQ